MVWIRRQQAGPLAVLAAWLAALLPWNVTYTSGGGIDVLFVRFPFFEFQYTSGFGPTVDGTTVRTVLAAIDLQSGQGLETATLVWGGGAIVTLVALLLSVVYYASEARLESLSVHPARLMGGILGLAALLFAAATAFVWTDGFGGVPIPVGVLLVGGLAAILLGAELTNDADSKRPDPTDTDPSVD